MLRVWLAAMITMVRVKKLKSLTANGSPADDLSGRSHSAGEIVTDTANNRHTISYPSSEIKSN